MLKELKSLLPAALLNDVMQRLQEWDQVLEEEESKLRQARDHGLHLKANCAAEEQTRVALMEKEGWFVREVFFFFFFLTFSLSRIAGISKVYAQ